MDGIVSNINAEMKASADYAIKRAKDRFGQELDFSEESLVKLNNILGQIYWGFSNHTKDEAKNGLIFNTAIIWGSYLGEYMCKEWGGTWIIKGSDMLVSIENNQFSPINFVYQKITSHPEYSVTDYLIELKIKKPISVFIPQPSPHQTEIISQPKEKEIVNQPKKNAAIDKRLIILLWGIIGILLVIVASIFGYMKIKTGGITALGLIASATSSNTSIPIEKTLVTATPVSTNTQYPSITPLPTYTASLTFTPRPSYTPNPTYTQTAALTPTNTKKPSTPMRTRTPTKSPTSVPGNPIDTPITPTIIPSPTATRTQLPTNTPIPPTDTQVPPTDTQIPLTDTPIPPTDTPIPPSDTPIPYPAS
jgi:hypothetical protein